MKQFEVNLYYKRIWKMEYSNKRAKKTILIAFILQIVFLRINNEI